MKNGKRTPRRKRIADAMIELRQKHRHLREAIAGIQESQQPAAPPVATMQHQRR